MILHIKHLCYTLMLISTCLISESTIAQKFHRYEFREVEGKYSIWKRTLTFDENKQHKLVREKQISGFDYDHIELLDWGDRYWVYQQGTKKGIIDGSIGESIIDPTFDDIWIRYPMLLAKTDGKLGVIQFGTKPGMALPCIYDSISYLGPSGYNLNFLAQRGDTLVLVNNAQKELLKLGLEGTALRKWFTLSDQRIVALVKDSNNEFKVLSTSGKPEIQFQPGDSVKCEGLYFSIYRNGSWYLANYQPNKFGYQELGPFEQIGHLQAKKDARHYGFLTYRNGQYGLIRYMDTILETAWDSLAPMDNPQAIVAYSSGKAGLLSLMGDTLVPIQFDSVLHLPISEAFPIMNLSRAMHLPHTFIVQQGDKYGIWNKDTLLVAPTWDKILSIQSYRKDRRKHYFLHGIKNREATKEEFSFIERKKVFTAPADSIKILPLPVSIKKRPD